MTEWDNVVIAGIFAGLMAWITWLYAKHPESFKPVWRK